MPTYQNNTETKQTMSGPRNQSFVVDPGESIEVSFFIDDLNFTKTAYTPLFNRATATTSVTLSTSAADHALNADTRIFIVTQIVGTVTVKPQVDTAVPVLQLWASDDPVIVFNLDDHPCDMLRVTGGSSFDTCTIMEYAY